MADAIFVKTSDGDATVNHARNFLDCVKSRNETRVNAETGHRVATTCHLANLSLRTGRKIEWDAEKLEVTNLPEANQYVRAQYRKGWKLTP